MGNKLPKELGKADPRPVPPSKSSANGKSSPGPVVKGSLFDVFCSSSVFFFRF
jgi:hypothetical protein